MTDDVVVTSITLEEDFIVLQYVERREQSSAAALARSIMIDMKEAEEEVEELREIAATLIDKGMLLIRNPPKRLREPEPEPEDE